MGKQSPELSKLIDGVRGAVVERERVAELARTIDVQVAAAESRLADAHADLDRFLVGERTPAAPVESVSEPGDVSDVVLLESDGEQLRWKVSAGLIDEAPCSSSQPHEPHQWDDELGAVVCLGVQPAA